MSKELVNYQSNQIPELLNLYDASYLFAKEVGDLDWIYPFPRELIAEYITNSELYGLNDSSDEIDSSVRLYEKSDSKSSLFIGKLAVSRRLKGGHFTQEWLLPAIKSKAHGLDKSELRLTCLAHNDRLLGFYAKLGFIELDEREASADSGHGVLVKEMLLTIEGP